MILHRLSYLSSNFVQLPLTYGTKKQKILCQNPTLSSLRYRQPIWISFIKETPIFSTILKTHLDQIHKRIHHHYHIVYQIRKINCRWNPTRNLCLRWYAWTDIYERNSSSKFNLIRNVLNKLTKLKDYCQVEHVWVIILQKIICGETNCFLFQNCIQISQINLNTDKTLIQR